MDQLLPFLLRHRAVQTHVAPTVSLQNGLDQIEHGGPFTEEHDFAVFFLEQPVEEFLQFLKLAGIGRFLLVHQERAVRRHAAHEQRFLQAQQVHLADVFLTDNGADDTHVGTVHFQLFVGGCNAEDLSRAWRQIAHHRCPGASEQDRLQLLAQIGKFLVAQYFALFVHNAMPVEKAEGGSQPAVVDELDHRIQIVQPVLQRRAGQNQGERRSKAFDDTAGFGFPVLDALAFVQDDQVPFHTLNGQDVAQNLLVVADREEAVVVVLCRSSRRVADDQLAIPVTEPVDLVAPLRFERRGANDENLLDAGFPGEQLGDADALDRFAQPHVISQDGSAGPDGESDAVKLVGKQFRLLQQLGPKRMAGRIASDLGHVVSDPVQKQPLLDVLFGIRVDGNVVAKLFQFADASDQVMDIFDGHIAEGPDDGGHFGIQLVGKAETQ